MSNPTVHLSGHFNGFTHHLPQRVYYAETDAGGVMYHASYLNLAERARMEFLRLLGHSVIEISEKNGLIFALRHCEIDFLAPAFLDDLLGIESTIVEMGGASLKFRQVINRNAESGLIRLAELNVTLVAITKDAKATRIPDSLRKDLEKMVEEK